MMSKPLQKTAPIIRWLKRMIHPRPISLPANLDSEEAIQFLNQLYQHKDEPHLSIDFNSLQFAQPFGTILTALGIRQFIRQRKAAGKKTSRTRLDDTNPAISYLKFIGFFKLIGIDQGRTPGEAPGGARYVPLTEIREDVLPGTGRIQERIDTESQKLSAVLRGQKPKRGLDILSYSLRESIRNIFEHARTSTGLIMAQRWSGGAAEIAVADEGVGLFETLSEAHQVANPLEALRLALQPGISRIKEAENADPWQNSGFGLYVLSELGTRLGSFAIASDGLILLRNKEREITKELPFKSTAVTLHIEPTKSYFPALLKEIASQGEKQAEKIPGARRSASKSSKTGTV